MPKKQWDQVKELFHEALRHDTGERDAFLETACGGNIQLRIEVESLLIALSDATTFLEQPLVVDEVRESPWQLSDGQSISHYTIVSPIGIGGMGEVYLARDNQLHRSVALKILPADLANDMARLRRFQNEAEAVSALNHPNILTIFEFGETDGIHLFASEFVKGETLRQRLSRERRLPVADAVDIAMQMASALKAAHEAGVIHRDIKPENVMIRDDGYVKVLDFGLAKFSAPAVVDDEAATRVQDLSHPGMIMGTTSYMSPEQARGWAIDARTDLFSFGVVLHEMLGGHVPFRGLTKTDVLAALIQYDPPPVSSHNSKVPHQLDTIVSKCLEKAREDRYASATDLLAALKASLVPELAAEVKAEERTELLPAVDDTAPTPRGPSRWLVAAAAAAILALAALTAAYFTGRLSFVGRTEPQIRSLAVLPLKSLDSGDNYLGLGIADAVIRRISQTGELVVRPTSTIRKYLTEDTDALEAAKQLGADAVLEGSVQRTADRLRVSVNLLRTADGKSLWADNFDMQASDIFAIQDSVAQQVSTRLRLRLDPEQKAKLDKRSMSANPVAYEYYLRGLYSFDTRMDTNRPQMQSTISLFEKAIESDPGFALAHAQLALAYAAMALFVDPTNPEWIDRAKAETKVAESLDSQLADTHLARSLFLWSGYENYQNEASIREILAAQQIDPNVGHAELAATYAHLGLERQADREIHRAVEIDPTSEFVRNQSLNVLWLGNKYDEYMAAANGSGNTHGSSDDELSWYLLGKGRLDEARKVIDLWAKKSPDNNYIPRRTAILFALKNDFAAAESQIPKILARQPVMDPNYHHAAYDIALVYALEGKAGESVKWLRKSAETGFPNFPLFERDRNLDRVRNSPDFVQFMSEMSSLNERLNAEFP
ncbi:MAG: protein kinase [Acidobacteriota bacterium]